MKIAIIDRRDLLRGFGLTGTVLAVGWVGAVGDAFAAQGPGRTEMGPFIGIAEDGGVTIVCPAADMGQGALDSMGRLVAEELGCAWDQVTMHQAWADPRFVNPIAGKQRTANSESVKGYWNLLRQAGAAARVVLVAAAAKRLGVASETLSVADGMVRHAGSRRSMSFGQLVGDATAIPLPERVALKPASQFTLIGKTLPRKDIPSKVDGTAQFGMDVSEPGMLTAALCLAPHPDAEIVSFDAKAALAAPGVFAVTRVDAGVAVLADSFWHAYKAAELVTLVIGANPVAGVDNAKIDALFEEALKTGATVPFPNFDTRAIPPKMTPSDRPAVEAAFARAAHVSDAVYQVPYLAHAAMEPLCCSAKRTPDGMVVTGPIQAPGPAREAIAEMTGLPLDKVAVNLTYLGGGFGRKWPVDFVRIAVQAAQAAPGRLVRTIWTRDQDFAVDQFRPGFRVRYRSAFDATRTLIGMHAHMAGQSINTYQRKPQIPGVADPNAAGLLVYDRYEFPGKLIDFAEVDLKIPVGYWRGVTFSQNCFFSESAIDEAARFAGIDGYRFRRTLLAGDPRTTAVLDKAAEMIDWDAPRPKGRGRGIALVYSSDNFCAQAAEVEVIDKRLVIHRIVCAFDCGPMVDPANVEAQISGGIVFGLQAALWGEVEFRDGQAVQRNFSDYRMPLIAETPPIEIALLPTGARPGGCGESGSPPIAPAITNAIADAGGERIRRLPIARSYEL